MQFSSLFLAICLSTSVLAKGHENAAKNTTGSANTMADQCKQLQQLTAFTNLASNDTKLNALAAKKNMTTTEVADIKAKAANATAELSTLSSNTTLVSTCSAVQQTESKCAEVQSLTALSALASNTTKMDAIAAKNNLTDTQKAELMSKAANATTKLATLSSNATLMSECQVFEADKKADGETEAALKAESSSTATSTASTASSTTAKSAAAMAKLAYGLFGTAMMVAFGMVVLA